MTRPFSLLITLNYIVFVVHVIYLVIFAMNFQTAYNNDNVNGGKNGKH